MTKKIPWRKPFLWIWNKLGRIWHFIIETNWTWLLWLVGAAIIVALGLYVYVSFKPESTPLLYHLFGLDSIKEKGTIFSNTSAPIVALGAAALMFLSFWAQYQANQRQWKWIKRQEEEKKYERIQRIIDLINNDFENDFVEAFGIPLQTKGDFSKYMEGLEHFKDILMDGRNHDDNYKIIVLQKDRFLYDLYSVERTINKIGIYEVLIETLDDSQLSDTYKKIVEAQIRTIIQRYYIGSIWRWLNGILVQLLNCEILHDDRLNIELKKIKVIHQRSLKLASETERFIG